MRSCDVIEDAGALLLQITVDNGLKPAAATQTGTPLLFYCSPSNPTTQTPASSDQEAIVVNTTQHEGEPGSSSSR